MKQINDAKWNPNLTHRMGEWGTQVTPGGTVKTRICEKCRGAEALISGRGHFASDELFRDCRGS